MTYNLNDAIAYILATSDVTSPDALAKLVVDDVPSEELCGAFLQVLTPYVRVAMARQRQGNPILAGAGRASGADRINSARSPKVAGIRNAWQEALQVRVHVGGHQYKLLGHCTFADLMFAAEERRAQAKQSSAKADEYEALANRLAECGVSTVAELPPCDIGTGGAAA